LGSCHFHACKTWIFDKIHHEINQFCSSHTLQEVYITLFDTLDEHLKAAIQADCDVWAPGIEIINVRVTKPKIPDQIRSNFEQMEAEKTKLLIAVESQKVAEKEAETDRKRATIEAQKFADVASINMEKELMQETTRKTISAVQDQTHLAKERSWTDAVFYKQVKEADANTALLTAPYLDYMHILALANNTKVYFGDKVPSLFVDKQRK
jgi:regulator of protease activity HflC (stomatin/prohibitin superfamily)